MAELFVISPLTPDMRARLTAAFTLHDIAELDDPTAWLAEHGARIDYVLTDGHLGVPPQYIEAMPNLRAISCFGVGYDNIDTADAVRRGVPVSHTPGVLDEEVATTALMLYIACFRTFRAQLDLARSGRWETDGNLPLAHSADRRTVGILGLGRIGKAVARKLAPFGARILYSGRTRQDVPYTYYAEPIEMARDAEALISVLPGGATTRHLVDARMMEALGPDGVLVNVGRGSVVDEAALIEALETGKLGAAGLDVFEDEPRIPAALRALDNAVLTPHIGSATVETRAAMGNLAIDNLLKHAENGRLLSPVPECAHMVELG